MKKAIIATIAVVLAAALGIGSYFVFFAEKDEGTVNVTIDDFYDSPDLLESFMTRPEKFTKILENEYHLGTEKTAEFYECPEEWLTYAELITVENTTKEPVTVFALDVAENGKNGVYICTSLDGEFEIAPDSSTSVYFYVLCDNGDLSTDEAKALVSAMDIKIVYRDASDAEYSSGVITSYVGSQTANVNTATN